MKTKPILVATLLVMLVMLAPLRLLFADNSNLSNLFRFGTKDAHVLETKENVDTIEPYIPFKLMVVQTAGVKHKNGEGLQCTPDNADGSHVMKMTCVDGTKFNVIGIEFPGKP